MDKKQLPGGFSVIEPLPGVHHIMDALGVCMTLLTGQRAALLVDTGYGLQDVSAAVEALTGLPYQVLLTHAHHDHAIGARWFDSVMMFPEDLPDFREYTGAERRAIVLGQAADNGLTAADDYLARDLPEPLPLKEGAIDLGGLTAQVIHCPGHTPGSAMVWVPEHRLLLTGDDWNPCTWLFFTRAVPLRAYLANMRAAVSALPADWALCSHQHRLFPADALRAFLSGLTDERLEKAVPTDLSPDGIIDPRRCELPDGQYIVFDWNKYHTED